MDRDQFDRLSRIVGAAGSRRSALGLLVAAAATGLASAAGAAPRRRGRPGGRGRHDRRPNRVRAARAAVCTQACRDCSAKPIRPGADLSRCDFDGESFVDDLDLRSTNISGACFAGAELRGAKFNGANADGTCFAGADLIDASFRGANVRDATFCGATLYGVDFRGSNVTKRQLDCAAFVGCTTILPNGKPAVACPRGATCRDGSCVAPQPGPANCSPGGAACPPCQTCQAGRCVAVPDDSVACDGSALVSAGPDSGGIACTATVGTGICVGGACTCPNGAYDAGTNACRCDPDFCAGNSPPFNCCQYYDACTDGTSDARCRCPAG